MLLYPVGLILLFVGGFCFVWFVFALSTRTNALSWYLETSMANMQRTGAAPLFDCICQVLGLKFNSPRR